MSSSEDESKEECQEFHDFTVKGDLEILINEFEKIGHILGDGGCDEFRISFEFRNSKFCILSSKKAKPEKALESLGHLGHPSKSEQSIWRMFNQMSSWVIIIRCDDPEVHLSVETTKLFLSAVSCSNVFQGIPVVVIRNDDGEFLSTQPYACALKIYGDWKPIDAIKWAQAKSSYRDGSPLKISVVLSAQIKVPSVVSFSPVVSPRAVLLPIGKYFNSPKSQLSIDFINPCAQPNALEFEDCSIWRVKLCLKLPEEPSVLESAQNMLRTIEHIVGQPICPGENEDLHSKTKVIQTIKSSPQSNLYAPLLQFVLFAQEPKPFKDRFLLALLATFMPSSVNGYSSIKKGRELLSAMVKLYSDVIQAVADVLDDQSTETLGIAGILPKPIWSDALIFQHLSSIEFMLNFSQRNSNLKKGDISTLKLLNSDKPLIVPETLDDGSEGMTSDWADIHSVASMKTQKDQRAYKRLASDMQAFKSANPESCLADFVRWHSPRDWNESTQSLSERMSTEDSDWNRMWSEFTPLDAEEQPPLFNPKKEMAKSLHYLEHLEVKDWLQQMNPHFQDFIKEIIENKLKSVNLAAEDSTKDSEYRLWIWSSLKSLGFDSINVIDLIQGKVVLISEDVEREAILNLKPKLQTQETFVEGSKGERFYVKCNFDGTTMLGQG